ncbi:MAG TPA: hypothetical protein VE978_14270 [Chitinophagales bacterium]|nr:hypothetical protein [Chitinophagales bacterium]
MLHTLLDVESKTKLAINDGKIFFHQTLFDIRRICFDYFFGSKSILWLLYGRKEKSLTIR